MIFCEKPHLSHARTAISRWAGLGCADGSPGRLLVALHKQHDVALDHELLAALDKVLLGLVVLVAALLLCCAVVGRRQALRLLRGRRERSRLGGVRRKRGREYRGLCA